MFSKSFFIVFIIIIFLASIMFVKRYRREVEKEEDKPSGCALFGIVLIISFLVTLFAMFPPIVIYDWATKQAEILENSEPYQAEIIDVIPEDYRSSQTERMETRYYPIYRFLTSTGDTIIIQAEGTDIGTTEIGEIRTVHYNAEMNRIVTLDASTAILPIGMLFMFIPLVCLMVGFFRYCLGGEMKPFYDRIKKLFMFFYLPLIILAFNALLIYAFLYGGPQKEEDGYWIAKIFLIFAIAILTLVLYGFVKMLFSKETRINFLEKFKNKDE